MDNNITLGVRAYPIDDPKGNTLAFASVSIDDLAAIRGIRVVSGKKGRFISMPQARNKNNEYYDIAFPLTGDLRKQISTAILGEFDRQANLPPNHRGYEGQELPPDGMRRPEGVNLDVKVFPVSNPKGDTLAFASVAFDNLAVIRGIRVVDSNKELFVAMPQSKNKNGEYRDIAFPLSGDLRKELSKTVLAEYQQITIKRTQSIGERIDAGKEQALQHSKEFSDQMTAKKSQGLGD